MGDPLSAQVGEAWSLAVAGSPSPLPYRNEMEERFGEDFSRVRAFLGRPGPMEAIGAHAATRGEDVVFAERAPSKKLVAHELTHVVQRRRGASGRVRMSLRLSQPGDAAEREAERVGDAVQRQPREQGLPLASRSNGATSSTGGISRAKKNIGYQDNNLLLEGSEHKTNAKKGLVSEDKKESRKTVLKRLKKKGVSYVRVMFYWRKAESSIEKLKTQLPSFFDDVRDVKMRAYVTLTGGTKGWTGGGGDFTSKNKSSEIASYKAWTQEILKLAKDSDKSKKGFDDVSIWNEPNLSTFLKTDGKGFSKNKKKNVSVAKTYVDIYRETTMDSTTGDLLDKSAKHAFGEVSSKLALEFLKAIETNERRQKREISKENKQAAKNQTKGSSSPSTTKHYHPVIAHYLALHPYKDDPNSGEGQRSGALNAHDLKGLKAQLRSMKPYLQTPGGKALPIRITEFGYPDSEYGERNALNLASRLDRTGLTGNELEAPRWKVDDLLKGLLIVMNSADTNKFTLDTIKNTIQSLGQDLTPTPSVKKKKIGNGSPNRYKYYLNRFKKKDKEGNRLGYSLKSATLLSMKSQGKSRADATDDQRKKIDQEQNDSATSLVNKTHGLQSVLDAATNLLVKRYQKRRKRKKSEERNDRKLGEEDTNSFFYYNPFSDYSNPNVS